MDGPDAAPTSRQWFTLSEYSRGAPFTTADRPKFSFASRQIDCLRMDASSGRIRCFPAMRGSALNWPASLDVIHVDNARLWFASLASALAGESVDVDVRLVALEEEFTVN